MRKKSHSVADQIPERSLTRVQRGLFVFLFLLTLLTVPSMFFIIVYAGFGLLTWTADWQVALALIIIPAVYLVITTRVALIIFKALQYQADFLGNIRSIRFLLLGLYFLSTLLPITLVLLFFESVFNDKPPRLFPFDDEQAIYSVINNDGRYLVSYRSTSDKNKFFTCTWERSGEKRCYDQIDREVEVMVGKSDVDLDSFVGKSVELEGDFAYSDKQCVARKCQHIGNYGVLNINWIKLK